MAASTYERALSLVLKHEGGYVNHPDDPGGATNKGVTQTTYNAYRKRQGQPERSVREITEAELRAIYRRQYWDAVRGDDLPSGLDYAMFDYAVNSGPARAAKELQRILGVADDGVVGLITLGALSDRPIAALVDELCDRRMAFLRGLRHWPTFGKGWTTRVADVRSVARGMAPATAKAPTFPFPIPDVPLPDLSDLVPKPKSWLARIVLKIVSWFIRKGR